MDDDTEIKLKKNIRRLTAIHALRKIRTLVDGYCVLDRKNKRAAAGLVVALVVTLFLIIMGLVIGEKEVMVINAGSAAEAICLESIIGRSCVSDFPSIDHA